jgi:hypothetical protein
MRSIRTQSFFSVRSSVRTAPRPATFLALFFVLFSVLLSSCTQPADPGEGSSSGEGTSSAGGNDGNGGESSSSAVNWTSSLVLPAGADKAKADALYDSWKGIYYRTYEQELELTGTGSETDANKAEFDEGAVGSARIRFDAGSGCTPAGICTVSEGIGYAMLITYFQGDEDAFRRLWKYSKYHWVQVRGSFLMDWKTRSFVYGY